MKTKLLLLICLLSFHFLAAQDNIILYGLEQNYGAPTPINPFGNLESMDLVSINPNDGTKTTLFEIDEAMTVASGSSTYNAAANEYFFWGYDAANSERIYSLDLDQGTTIANPTTQQGQVEIEYNYANGKVYSLQIGNQTSGNDIELVELDLNTGVTVLISDLPGIEATGIGNSTFDPVNNLYIGLGVTGSQNRIFGVDVLTGEMVYNAPLSQDNGLLLAFEYDWTNQRLLGIRQTTDMTNPFYPSINNYLVEIDLATGVATDLFTDPVFKDTGVAVGGVSFDQQSQTYITYVGGNFDLGMINTNTGELFNVVTMGKAYYELQVDNLPYAQAFLSSTPPTSIKNNLPVEELVIAPNPVEDELRIDLGDDFQEGSVLEIFDINGKNISNNNINTSWIKTSTTGFNSGVYIVRIITSDKILSGKFIKL